MVRRMSLGGAMLVALLTTACSDEPRRAPTFPVTGKIAYANKSLEHATIVFHAIGESDPNVPRPHAKVEADGTFKLTTYDGGDGAPKGKYKVTIEQWLATPKSEAPPSNRLPPKFARVESSNITAEVAAAPNTLQTIELK